jgi:O-antigen ligase
MKLKNTITGFIIGALLITYLSVAPSLADSTLTGRFIVLSVCCFGGIFLLLPKLKNVSLQLFDLLLFGFYILNLISISWAHNFGEAVFTTQRYLLLFLCVLLFKAILREHKQYLSQIATVITLVTIVALLVTSYQLLQLYGTQGLEGKNIYLVNGLSGHKNLAASLLFLLFGLNIYFLLLSKTKSSLRYLLLLWQFIVILLLRSRSVYLALGLFAVLSFSVYLFSSPELRRMALRRVLPAALLMVVLGGGVLLSLGIADDYKKYLNPATYSDSASAKERQFVWYKTKELIADRPLLGYGSGNWKLYFPSKNVSGAFRIQEMDLVFTRAHNDYLEVWTEVGIIGVVLFCAIFFLPLWIAIQAIWKTKPIYRARWMVLGATLLGYMLIALFDFPKERIEHQLVLALIIALIIYRPKEAGLNKVLAAIPLDKRYLLVTVMALLLAINVPLAYYRYIGEQCSKQILTHKETNQNEILVANAIKGESRWYNVDGLVIPLSWYKGVSEYRQKDYTKAEASFAKAYEINPYNFNVINNYGSALVQNEAYKQAVDLYLKALEINPKFEEGMFNIAFSYYKLEQFEEALSWINKVEKNTEKRASYKRQIMTGWEAFKQGQQLD